MNPDAILKLTLEQFIIQSGRVKTPSLSFSQKRHFSDIKRRVLGNINNAIDRVMMNSYRDYSLLDSTIQFKKNHF